MRPSALVSPPLASYLLCLSVGLSAVFAASGCKRSPAQPDVTSYLADGSVKEEAIVADIEKQLAGFSRGVAENDADAIFAVFSEDKKATYIRRGEVVSSIDDARSGYKKALGELRAKRKFSFERKQYDILDEKTALFTGLGVIESEEAKEPWKIAYTILWTLEASGWKAIHMHISWQ